MSAPLYLRNVNSGEGHKLYQDDSGKYSRESCNLDDMKQAIEITEEEYNAGEQCEHCKAPAQGSQGKPHAEAD